MNDRQAETIEDRRDYALDALTTAYANGHIVLEDYEFRASALQKARSFADIDAQTLDLPRSVFSAPPPPLSSSKNTRRQNLQPPAQSAPRGTYAVESRSGSPEFSLCIMGDRKLAGDWLNADQATSLTLMGSTTLDLRDTALPPGRLKIDALAIMGELKIIVPPGLPVKMTAFPFMGEANVHRSVERRIVRGRPYLEVSGIALMGSIVVKAQDPEA
ncbi:MAG: hypothetical protein FD137_525 [Spirochaetes bacterium]|nr:MAG: hypothetical protein FD137_525 [Spirochaetota bacterium]